jgi:hypothetical protein
MGPDSNQSNAARTSAAREGWTERNHNLRPFLGEDANRVQSPTPKKYVFRPTKAPFTQGSPFGRNRPTRSGKRIARAYIIYNIVYGAQIDRLQFAGISNPLR